MGICMNVSKRVLKAAVSIAAVSLVLGGFNLAQGNIEAYASTTPGIEQTVDRIVNSYVSSGYFSGTILLEKHGNVLLEKGYGSADILKGTKNAADQRFAIGTLSQAFTAVSIMQLEEKGLLHLDDRVSKFLPNMNEAADYITIGELLTHTSGAPIAPNAPSALPNTVFQFSPLNYILLAQIVHAVTGQTDAAYIQQNILTPLGMSNTGFITNGTSSVPNGATGYTLNGNNIVSVDFKPTNLAGSDDMYSTVGDLYKWDQALYTGKLVKRQDLKLLFSITPLSVQALKTFGYGFGWEVSLDGARAENETKEPGFRSLLYRNMENDETLIILSNRDFAPLSELSQKLETALSQTVIPSPSIGSTVGGQKRIIVNSHTISKPFSRVAQSTTFMPIWYVGQALQSLGVKQSWDGSHRVWNITLPSSFKVDFSNIELGTGNTDIYVNGQLVKRINTYAWPDPASGNKSYTTYAPVFYVQQLLSEAGVNNTWDGQAWSAVSQ